MKLVVILVSLFTSLCVIAQTPYSIVNSHNKGGTNTQQVSVHNPWLGAKLSYSPDNDKPLYDNFLLSAKVLYTPVVGDNYAVPVVGVAGLGNTNLLNPESGVNLGVYPYYVAMTNDKFSLVAHAGVGYKVIVNEVLAGKEPPQQIRMLAGAEVAFFGKDGNLPTTLSVTPVYIYNSNVATNAGGSTQLEITGVLPIANGLGFLADVTVPFKSGLESQFRFGVIINGKL